MNTEKRVELLAPAGNVDAFYGAIYAGADAIYLGGSRFGARAYAENFSEETLVACIRYAHLFGRKVYLTVNTLVKESEFSELYDYLKPYYCAGLDGVIIQDMGVFTFIREHFPGMELHGSTQMTITGEYGAAFLKEQGACRVVPARELSLREIRRIKETTGLEIECFIHGAMCYCYSGQCLFSSILGGRSGNRGRCAQPCRLPYTTATKKKECYPLSLKDMCTIEDIPELIKAGIDSFKIEGRMKKPEYAAGVTAVYRKYLDKYYADPEAPWKISKEDMHILSSLYIRSERQNGYYHKHNGREMVTLDSPAYSGSDEAMLERIRNHYLEHKLQLPVRLEADFTIGQKASLTLTNGENKVTVEGDIVQEAAKHPITHENVIKQLEKLGETSFYTEAQITLRLSDNAFYPLKAINELRRKGISGLEEQIILKNGLPYERQESDSEGENHNTAKQEAGVEKKDVTKPQRTQQDQHEKKDFSVSIQSRPQWLGVCSSAFWKESVSGKRIDRMYLDTDFLLQNVSEASQMLKQIAEKSIQCILMFPKILRLKDQQYLKELSAFLQENTEYIHGFLVASLEQIGVLKQWEQHSGLQIEEKKLYGDHNLYIWNRVCRDFWRTYLDGFCLPLELTGAEQRDLLEVDFPAEKVIYGRIPMMITANCITKTTDKCRLEEGCGVTELIDRYHKVFPVIRNCTHCYNVIYNSVPLSLHKDFHKWSGHATGRIAFTTETEEDVRNILDYFAGVTGEFPFTEYTTGHEKRGVE